MEDQKTNSITGNIKSSWETIEKEIKKRKLISTFKKLQKIVSRHQFPILKKRWWQFKPKITNAPPTIKYSTYGKCGNCDRSICITVSGDGIVLKDYNWFDINIEIYMDVDKVIYFVEVWCYNKMVIQQSLACSEYIFIAVLDNIFTQMKNIINRKTKKWKLGKRLTLSDDQGTRKIITDQIQRSIKTARSNGR